MRRILQTAATGAAAIATIAVVTGSALAWTYGLTGTGQCQSDGSFKITWTVDNSVENQPLSITSSSDTSVVPVGTTVASNSTENFSQTAEGTTAATDTLTLQGNFPGDKTDLTRTASVTLSAACTQPIVVPAGSTTTPAATTTTTTSTPAPKTPAPVGSVNAGSGDPKSLDLVAAAGLISAAGLAIFGVRRLGKTQ